MRRERVSTESGPGHLVGLQFDRMTDADERRVSDLMHRLVRLD